MTDPWRRSGQASLDPLTRKAGQAGVVGAAAMMTPRVFPPRNRQPHTVAPFGHHLHGLFCISFLKQRRKMMVRALLVMALISAALTSLLFLLTQGSLTGALTKFRQPAAVYKNEAVATPVPPSEPPRFEPAVGGPFVPVPSPTPSPMPPLPTPPFVAAEPPAAEPMPVLDPAPLTSSQPKSTPAAPQAKAPQGAIAPASPSPVKSLPPSGLKVIYDQPKSRGKHWTGCTQFKSYNAATETYRGLDGQIHSCKPD
jgi:hypothetical protein